MYKGTFVAIAEVVGLYLAPPSSADTSAQRVEPKEAVDGASAVQSKQPHAGNGRSRPGPVVSFRTASDRRWTE